MKTTNNNSAEEANEFKLPETLKVFEDAHGGWLEVPIELLTVLKIADKISSKSKRKENNVYLLEGVDSRLFINAYIAYCYQTPGSKIFVLIGEDHGRYSPINDYPDYTY